MENASKALIIAGSVLIALMVIGALVLMFNNLSSYQQFSDVNVKDEQIVEFNKQFETYNRHDVRGSDLFTLCNKIVDYNRRKSEVGFDKDEGQAIKFQPMSITIKFISKDNLLKFTYDNEIRLFDGILKNYSFELKEENSNKFESSISNKISILEANTEYGGKAGLANLAAGIGNLFFSNPSSATSLQKTKAEELYFKNTKNQKTFYEINNSSNIKNDICSYYEYIQFKRGHFKCTKAEYSSQTGRILSLEFEFTGKIE